MKTYNKAMIVLYLLSVTLLIHSHGLTNGERLKEAYPDHVFALTHDHLIWHDTTHMPLTDFLLSSSKGASECSTNECSANGCSTSQCSKMNNPCLIDQIEQPLYMPGIPMQAPTHDPGRIRYEPFFRTMYGNSKEEVERHLRPLSWMPRIFGKEKYILLVTTINGVDKKLACISQELEELVLEHPEYTLFLDNPGGTYCWRLIANTDRLSAHSFGMTLDINAETTEYWQWDLAEEGRPINEEEPLVYHNSLPLDIVLIFEKYGFIWGGKWYHYDTMHFEYRPELFS
jgi:peptidoglycan LD-endopeptidase CwlK